MVREDKLNNALAALNTVLVIARSMAYERRTYEEIADVLDVAKYLPRLLAEPVDQTDHFRGIIADLSAIDQRFNIAVERFDDPQLGRW